MLENVEAWFQARLNRVAKLKFYQERRLQRLGLIDDDGDSTFEDMIRVNI